MTEAHLSLNDVGHRYPKAERPVLDGITLRVDRGEVVALVGRTGCGKSTLLHIAAGMLVPSHGTVSVGGEPVRGPSPRRVVMFQQPSLYPWMTVVENAGLGLRFAGRGASAAAGRVTTLLETLGLAGLAGRNVQDLSGGQQQRVALARSLAVEPELLLLDEPFSALDAVTRTALQDEIRALARSLGITVLLVTHDLEEAERMADRTVVMAPDPGRIRAEVRRADHAPGAIRPELLRHIEATAGLTAGDGI